MSVSKQKCVASFYFKALIFVCHSDGDDAVAERVGHAVAGRLASDDSPQHSVDDAGKLEFDTFSDQHDGPSLSASLFTNVTDIDEPEPGPSRSIFYITDGTHGSTASTMPI